MSNDVMMSAEGVNMHFGGVRALNDIQIGLVRGRWLGLIGPNGSGKSTLLNVLSGVYRPQQGVVRFGQSGENITRLSPIQRSRLGIFRTFQHPQLVKTVDLLENVMLGAKAGRARRPSGTDRSRSIAALDAFNCLGYAAALPAEVPYGVRKIVEVARAAAAEPVVLLLDEPAAGLSADERVELIDALNKFRLAYPDAAVCLVEHDVSLVVSLCEHLIVLNTGQRICEGDADSVLNDPGVRSAYLGQSGARSSQAHA